jgi:hypothetical protein
MTPLLSLIKTIVMWIAVAVKHRQTMIHHRLPYEVLAGRL